MPLANPNRPGSSWYEQQGGRPENQWSGSPPRTHPNPPLRSHTESVAKPWWLRGQPDSPGHIPANLHPEANR